MRRYEGTSTKEAVNKLVQGERQVARENERNRILKLLVGLRGQYREPIDAADVTEESLEQTLRAMNQIEGVNWELVRAAIAASALEHAIATVHNE